MTWTYTPDFTGSRDKIRLAVGDTDSTDPQITDEEIAYLALPYTTSARAGILQAAADCADTIAAKYARKVNIAVDKAKRDAEVLAKHYADLATALRTQATASAGVAPYAGGVSISDMETDRDNSDVVQPAFSRTLHEVPGAAPEAHDSEA
jgi:hypothetical protein